jgi:hypothetical protein
VRALTLLAVLVPVSAGAASVELDVTAGLGGHAQIGAWTPIRVVLDNKSSAQRGEIVVPPQPATDPWSDYRVSVDVPPSSRRAFLLYARLRIDAAAVEVEFRPERGAPTKAKATCSIHPEGSRVVLVVSRKAGGLGTAGAAPLGGGGSASGEREAGDSVVTYVVPDRATGALGLPDHPAGYEGIAAIVLRDISPADFEDSEREALSRWVHGGGTLLVMAGPNVAELRDSFVEELLPVRIRGRRVVQGLPVLARHFRAALQDVPVLVAEAETAPGAYTVVEQGGLPLLVRGAAGSGIAWFLAADCAAPPLNAADDLLIEMWTDVLEQQRPVREWAPLSRLGPVPHDPESRGGLSEAVVRLPVVEWEAFAVFGVFLLVYVAVLLAASLLLKRLDRREWMGLALLITVLAFSGGALYLGRAAHLASSRAYEAAVIAAHSGSGTAWLEGVSGLRSPAARSYSFAAAAQDQSIEYVCGARREESWPVYQQGAFTLRRVPVDLWGFGCTRVQGPWDLQGRVTTALVAVDGRRRAVSVRNETPHELKDVFVLFPGAVLLVPESIPAGETRETPPFEARLLEAAPQATNAYEQLVTHSHAADTRATLSARDRLRARLLKQLGAANEGMPYMSSPGGGHGGSLSLAPDEPLLGAWIDLPAPLVTVAPARVVHQSEALLLVDVPEAADSAALQQRTFALAPAFDASAPGIRAGMDGRISVASGRHELAFRLPMPSADTRPNSLRVEIGADQQGLGAEVLNYRTRLWEPLRMPVNAHMTHQLTPPGDYVRMPWVRMRLTAGQTYSARVFCVVSGELG